MSEPLQEPNKRRNGAFALAILLLLFAGGALLLEENNVVIRTVAMLALLVSVYCVRLSRSGSTTIETQRTGSNLATRPGRSIWIVSIILLPVLGMSFASLYIDAAHGYHQAWPVYVFTGTIIVCMVCWSYLLAITLR